MAVTWNASVRAYCEFIAILVTGILVIGLTNLNPATVSAVCSVVAALSAVTRFRGHPPSAVRHRGQALPPDGQPSPARTQCRHCGGSVDETPFDRTECVGQVRYKGRCTRCGRPVLNYDS
jgi:hypothetical protein